ncbi:hypothetical protein BO85DRAFT_499797 [Aspergillus piperis CBS 112811]|uniref:Protein kinase domain-containing protein n=1 Tax=Aspergillus piperis CBS 112811 TaxID=1448313 RepID=A0A8G1VJU9_9EURO|nr:hypothetical protein BO85DRAFT_499797 [Aspergillus piperis CBS 112811]RAH54637.1 hypothetical protein BO85DRAFT_499797 [Aspergillus piperis CBS 112811]
MCILEHARDAWALSMVTLRSPGYTFVGKGVPVESVQNARHKKLVYSHLAPIQGASVPFFSDSPRLRRQYSHNVITEIAHPVCIGYAGKALVRPHGMNFDEMPQQTANSLQAVHGLDVLHSDPIPGNIFWDGGNGRVKVFDFERAIIQNNDACH